MSWGYYEDFYGSEKEVTVKPEQKKDFTGLWLLGLGLLGGYMLFSSSDEEKKKDDPKPNLDNLDKAVANKIEYKSNPNTWESEGYSFEVGDIEDHGKYNALTIKSISPTGEISGKYGFYKEHDSNIIRVISSNTFTQHRRKYLANEAYSKAEKLLDGIIVASEAVGAQTKDAKKLHANENKLFGKLNPVETTQPLNVSVLSDLQTWGRVAREAYGRSVLPSMKNEDGSPSEIALRAKELGIPLPKNKKEAKDIARRGREALKKYKELKKSGIKKDEAITYKV